MDCDTTGIEPDFALVKFKKLAGGGYFKIINQSVPLALRNLGYSENEISEIVAYAKGHATLDGCPHINRESLSEKGLLKKNLMLWRKLLREVSISNLRSTTGILARISVWMFWVLTKNIFDI